ncbi:MAG TPA: 16S rRNA (uracil(1498)-N(3))-methyltransferase [Pyrinomonadaceae bacterium]|nr:16S rRNA (uracil(1498)-N(3))-methyltransferase [Pyrinomonadaceae bacterium]
MHRFYAQPQNFSDETVVLDADETRHLRDVLRLSVGEEVSVFDGTGREALATVMETGKKTTLLSIIEETAPASPESPLEITLAPTVLNGERYDLIIQKSVELGVTRLVPIHTVRCDVKLKDAARRLERWRRIALEATKQCGRARLMKVGEPTEFFDLIDQQAAKQIFMFSERGGANFPDGVPGDKITVVYGPKGGWEDSELEAARSAGVRVVTLGGRIMRAETAAIAITAILQHRFGDLN